MARRHRKPARLSPRARRTLLGIAMVAILAPVAGVALASAIGEMRDCKDSVSLDVAAAPEMAVLLDEHASAWSNSSPVSGLCVTVNVTPVDSASVATALSAEADADIDVGSADVVDVAAFDVWVPESGTWLSRLDPAARGLLRDRIDSVGESWVGLAVAEKDLENVGIASLLETPTYVPDPRSDAAGLAVMFAATEEVPLDINRADKDSGYHVMSQTAISVHNLQNPDDQLIFVELQQNIPSLDYPYAVRAEMSEQKAAASDAFRSSLLTTKFVDVLTSHLLMEPGPYPVVPDTERVEKAIKAWK